MLMSRRLRPQAAFWASWNTGWIDSGLAKAAYLLAMYEISQVSQLTIAQRTGRSYHCAHSTPCNRTLAPTRPCCPSTSGAACVVALTDTASWPTYSLLDKILESLSLASLDSADPRVSRFAEGEIPRISRQGIVRPVSDYAGLTLASEQDTSRMPFWGEHASLVALASSQAIADPPDPAFCPAAASPRWTSATSAENPSEIEKDETRRLVWASSTLASGFSLFEHNLSRRPIRLYIAQPENYQLVSVLPVSVGHSR